MSSLPSQPSNPTGPLAGMRILDLTSVLLGPYATKILGDLGADVIKIEPVEGEGRRDSGPQRNRKMAQTFMVLNRAKRAIAINLKDPAGRDAFLRLAATADAMVHNARVQAMVRLGLDYEGLRKVKPDITYCYAVGFGSKGRTPGVRRYYSRPHRHAIAALRGRRQAGVCANQHGRPRVWRSFGQRHVGGVAAS